MRKFAAILDHGYERLLSAIGIASVILIILLAAFISIQVFSRYLFSIHVPGLFDLSTYALIIFTFLSGAYTLRAGNHITVDILSRHFPERAKAPLDILVYLLSLMFCCVIGWSAWKWSSKLFSSGISTISETPIPKGILIASISLGFLLLGIELIRLILARIHFLRSRPKGTSPEGPHPLSPTIHVSAFAALILMGLLLAKYVSLIGGLSWLAIVMLFSGLPVFLALGLVGSVGLYLIMGKAAFVQIPFFAFQAVDSFPLTCLPLFIVGGIILERGQIVHKIYKFLAVFSGNFLSAPLVITILVGGFFCAISGSSVAATSIIAAVTLPILLGQGYDRALSSGVVAGSTIGTVIPPSIGYILYGVITGESIGQLFMAGLIPGAMIFGFYVLYVAIRGAISKESLFAGRCIPARARRNNPTLTDWLRALKEALWGLFAPIFVLGGIYMGVFTPSEAAAVMVVYAVFLTVILTRALTWKGLMEAVFTGAKISSMILLIIVGARIFGAVTSQARIAAHFVAYAGQTGISPLSVLCLVSLMLFVFGMFLDSASVMVITLPVFYPLVTGVGYDSVWFGVFFIVMLEIGLLTPPVGLNLFVIKGISELPMVDVIRGAFPFVLMMLLSLTILVLFPKLVLWLPATMID